MERSHGCHKDGKGTSQSRSPDGSTRSPNRNDLHPPGQRFRQSRRDHDVGGRRQQEAAGHSMLVHGQLDGREQVRGLLDFIEDDRSGKVSDEPGRIRGGQREGGGIVEGEVGGTGTLADGLSESGLTGLAGPVEEDDRSIAQGAPEGLIDMSPDHGRFFTGSW